MPDLDNFSALVGDIYDASLDPALWPGVFDKASTFIGGSAAALSSYDIVAKQTHFYFSSGHEPHFLEQYTEKYARINPVFPTVVFHDVERPLAIPDCLPREVAAVRANPLNAQGFPFC